MGIDKKKKDTVKYIIYSIIAFGMIFVLNQRTVFTADDYMYHFFWEQSMPSENTRWLNSIKDIPEALVNHYNGYNGRIISHAIVMFFAIYDKWIFNVCNSLMYLFVGVLLLMHIETDAKKWRAGYLGTVYLSMWLFFPEFGRSVLWFAGACNYLWMCSLALLFLLPYRKYTERKHSNECSITKCAVISVLGFCAGCTSENMGGAAILLTIFYIGYWYCCKKKIPLWSLCGMFFACVGMLVLLLAPSSQGRMAEEAFALVFLKRLREIVGFSSHYVMPLLMIIIILGSYYIRSVCKNDKKRFWDMIVPLFYCISGAASVVVLFLSPVIGGKSWIWADCCLIIAAGLLYKILLNHRCVLKKWMKTVGKLSIVIAFVWYGIAFHNINQTYVEVQEQIRLIEIGKENGNLNVEVPILTHTENSYNAIYYTPNVEKDKNAWFNQWMALYYGVDTITGK